jgi:hypothetical protein
MSIHALACVRLVTTASSVDAASLEREFPTVRFERAHGAAINDVVIDAEEWRSVERFDAFDRALSARPGGDTLAVWGARDVEAATLEVVTRYQRFVGRRNDASRTPLFDAVLGAHRALHDVDKPLVRADLDHALDTWQWMLRLEPEATLAAQLAALFHDVERLESEADERVEHRAADYQSFKDAHARRGAERCFDVLRAAGVTEDVAARVRAIVAVHERRGADPEVDLLNDADALSFFSLNSPGYLDYFGEAQTRKKLAYTSSRASSRARDRLASVRLRPDVRALMRPAAPEPGPA